MKSLCLLKLLSFYLILMFFSGALTVLILILAVSAFAGKSYKITKILDFLKNNP